MGSMKILIHQENLLELIFINFSIKESNLFHQNLIYFFQLKFPLIFKSNFDHSNFFVN